MNKLILLISSILAFAISGINTSKANMAIGGELIYVHVGDSTYQVVFKMYQNCAATSTPDSMKLCVRNTCNNMVLSRQMKLFNNGFNGSLVNPFCPNATNSCNSSSSKNIAYKVYFYSDTVTLPSRCIKWIFSVNVGKRMPLNNMLTVEDMYIEATLNNSTTHSNNSPYYSVWPRAAAESGFSFTQKVGALEPDADSLYTYVINPLTSTTTCGDTANVVLFSPIIPPYNLVTNPIQTNNTFYQHKASADFGFAISALQGHSTLVFRTDEYRNGVLIGSVMREMLIQVVPPAPAKQIDVKLTCDTPHNSGSVNDTIYACVNQQVEMCYAITAPTGSRLFVSDDAMATIPGASVTYLNQGTDSVHVKFTWTPGLSDAGKDFILTHMIVDSTCNPGTVVRTSTKSFKFHIWDVTSAGKDTTICPGGISAMLKVTGGGNFRWTILPGGTPNSLNDTTIANPVATPFITTTYAVRSTKNEYCQYRTKDTVAVIVNTQVSQPAISITVSPSVNIWQWLNVTFTATGSGCTAPFYQWILNGSDIPGATAATWSSTTLTDNDVVSCRLSCGDFCSDPEDTVSNSITMNVATSVNDVQQQKASLYPNPNNGTFTLQLNNDRINRIEIVNTFGQVVHTAEIQKTAVIDLHNMPQGIYTVRVNNEKETYTIKFTTL